MESSTKLLCRSSVPRKSPTRSASGPSNLSLGVKSSWRGWTCGHGCRRPRGRRSGSCGTTSSAAAGCSSGGAAAAEARTRCCAPPVARPTMWRQRCWRSGDTSGGQRTSGPWVSLIATRCAVLAAHTAAHAQLQQCAGSDTCNHALHPPPACTLPARPLTRPAAPPACPPTRRAAVCHPGGLPAL